jgi:hypothetical protein
VVDKRRAAYYFSIWDTGYPQQPRKRAHYSSIYRALRRLGCKRIGWGIYAR